MRIRRGDDEEEVKLYGDYLVKAGPDVVERSLSVRICAFK